MQSFNCLTVIILCFYHLFMSQCSYVMFWGFFLFVMRFHQSKFLLESNNITNMSFNSLLPGHQSALPLPCTVGRQLFYRWRVPAAHLPVVPHLRALYPLSLHPCASLLRPPGGLPCPLPSGRQRTWQVRKGESEESKQFFAPGCKGPELWSVIFSRDVFW